MAACKVGNVNEIAAAGAIGCVVIVAKNTKSFELAGCDLHDVRHEVVGDAVRIFAEEARGMVADGVKVTQGDGGKIWIRSAKVL